MPLSLTITGAVAARALPTKEQPHHAEDHTHAHPHEHNEEPVVEALRIYVDRINAAGGVNGKTINLLIEDDLAMPWKAAANTKKLLTENRAVLMLNASLPRPMLGLLLKQRMPACR
jgi:Periplasmic binding protein